MSLTVTNPNVSEVIGPFHSLFETMKFGGFVTLRNKGFIGGPDRTNDVFGNSTKDPLLYYSIDPTSE